MSRNRADFNSMSTDELWSLFEDLAATLTHRMAAEKSELEDRLKLLNRSMVVGHTKQPAPRRLSH